MRSNVIEESTYVNGELQSVTTDFFGNRRRILDSLGIAVYLWATLSHTDRQTSAMGISNISRDVGPLSHFRKLALAIACLLAFKSKEASDAKSTKLVDFVFKLSKCICLIAFLAGFTRER